MTSKFTREELLNIIETDHVQCGEASALARMALAAMDSEPVTNAQLPIGRERLEQIHWAAKSLGNYCRADEIEALAAFALSVIDAQPAPVVPAEKTMPNPLSMYAVDAVAAIAEVKGWNACRATMLQAGNSPVIPDGYVMVPKEPTPEILATITEAIRAMRGSAATYARVLAAAPQEVK